VLVLSLVSVSEARVFGRRNNNGAVYGSVPEGHHNGTAQDVAHIMAHLLRVGHFGGNPGYEGCGSASTQAGAYNNCCYSTSGMKTVDVGYAQGRNGMWFCCRRYR